MKNQQTQPNPLPLNIILIGTSILVLPAVYITFLMSGESDGKHADSLNLLSGAILGVTIFGFILFGGYILTAVYRRHSRVFWFFSMIFNLILSAGYGLVFLAAGGSMSLKLSAADTTGKLIMLLPFWTLFVAIASGYYFTYGWFDKKSELV